MTDLREKIAIVTGASKGIGAAIAKSFAQAGASVVVNYATSKESADKVVKEIESKGGKAIAVQGDVSKAADVRRLFEETKQTFGSPTILINNAAVYAFEPIETVTEEEFQRQFNINVWGIFLTTQEALKHFPDSGGNIINLSTVASKSPVPNSSVYASTKGAVDTLTSALAMELAARKIRVNAIAPGGTETEGAHEAGIVGSDFAKKLIEATPLGRFGQPEDIARVALFLSSDEAAWITGERITVSGGLK